MRGVRARVARWVFGRPNGLRAAWLAWVRERLRGAARAPARRPPPVAPAAHPDASTRSSPPGTSSANASPGRQVARSADLAEGAMIEVSVEGRALVVCRVDGQVHAFGGACPHAGGPLCDGDLQGASVVCPWHGWTFNVRTGACEVDPDSPLDLVPCGESGGSIWVAI